MKPATARTPTDAAWTLFRGKDGQWQVRFRSPLDGSWHNHRVPRKHALERDARTYAKDWYADLLLALEATPAVTANAGEPAAQTIRSLAPRWFQYMDRAVELGEIRPATRLLRSQAIEHHVLSTELADTPIDKVGPGVLRAWLRSLKERISPTTARPLSASRIRNIVASLRAFIADTMAEEWAELPANPLKHDAVTRLIPEGVPAWGRRRKPHLTRNQVERLVTCHEIPEWRRVHHLFAATSGLAQGELFGLQWRDVDLKAGVVRISKALALVTKAKRPGLAATKTENRVRDLPIHSAALKVLTAWHAKGFAEFAGRAPRDEDPVFPAPRCTGELVHWRPKMSPMLRKDLRSSGQSDHFEGHPLTAHGLRRSFASWLAEADVSLLNRQRLMGHAAANVTDGAYTSTSLDTLRVAVESIKLVLSVGEVVAFPVKIVSAK